MAFDLNLFRSNVRKIRLIFGGVIAETKIRKMNKLKKKNSDFSFLDHNSGNEQKNRISKTLQI